MTLEKLKQQFIEELQSIYDKSEIESIFFIYLEDKLGLSFSPNTLIENDFITQDLAQLKQGKPIQHITGKAFFYNDFFEVNEFTLIPRPETEELIELIRTNYQPNDELHIIDLGTGSGCIPITLAQLFPQATVTALDISEDTLKVAQKNATKLMTEIQFYQKDLLQPIDLERKFDLIISNPPYIRNLEKVEMHQNVLEFEPHLALFVEDEHALIFYERIIAFAQNHLKENGCIYCEINQYLGKETKELFEEVYQSVEIIQDIAGNDRMLKAFGLK